MKRRKFIRISAASAPALSLFPSDMSFINRFFNSGTMEKRELGLTGEKLSILGLGGVVLMDSTPEEAADRVSRAYERGINYFDVAPTYGNAQLMMGPALEPYRKNVFLACKTTKRTAAEAQAELEQSLTFLRTDYFDLYQLHAVTTLEEVNTIFSPGGAMETFEKAREEGRIRFIGFSAHSAEAALALMDHHNFDTILFPVNYACWHAGNFGPQVLEKAKKAGCGHSGPEIDGQRPLARRGGKNTKVLVRPITQPEEALQALRFTLSHPVTAAIPPGNEDLFFMALDLIEKFTPMDLEEIEQIKIKALNQNPLFRYPQG